MLVNKFKPTGGITAQELAEILEMIGLKIDDERLSKLSTSAKRHFRKERRHAYGTQ